MAAERRIRVTDSGTPRNGVDRDDTLLRQIVGDLLGTPSAARGRRDRFGHGRRIDSSAIVRRDDRPDPCHRPARELSSALRPGWIRAPAAPASACRSRDRYRRTAEFSCSLQRSGGAGRGHAPADVVVSVRSRCTLISLPTTIISPPTSHRLLLAAICLRSVPPHVSHHRRSARRRGWREHTARRRGPPRHGC